MKINKLLGEGGCLWYTGILFRWNIAILLVTLGSNMTRGSKNLIWGWGGGGAIKSYQKETIQQYYLGQIIPKEMYAY